MSSKSEEYRRLADEADAQMSAADLPNVRAKLAEAAAVWAAMAEREEQSARSRAERHAAQAEAAPCP